MAWRCGGRSNTELVNNLFRSQIITSEAVKNAMLATDRAFYVKDVEAAYEDSPQPISASETISAPHMHAYALEELKEYLLRPNSWSLDVGSGSGYLTACMARLSKGPVIGIDHRQSLVDWARENVQKDDDTMLTSGKIDLKATDAWKYEYSADGGVFDCIHVGAAAARMPENLVHQLKPGGIMIIPVGEARQELVKVKKNEDGGYTTESLMGVRYVPLVEHE